MSWMDSWSRPSKHQATPAPYYLLPGGEATPYCQSCGRVISSRRTGASAAAAAPSGDNGTVVKYCSSRCRSHKPGKLDREIENVFVGFMSGKVEKRASDREQSRSESGPQRGTKKSTRAGGGKKVKGDTRILVSCDDVEKYLFGHDSSELVSGTEDGHAADGNSTDLEPPQVTTTTNPLTSYHTVSTGTLEDPTASPRGPPIDYDVLARLSVRSGTRIRPPQSVSEVNGSVGGEKGRAERVEETDEMLEKRREGLRKARQREMVRCAARRGVVFGFTTGEDAEQEGDGGGEARKKKCEAVMLGKVVEPSFAKGDWSVRWRE